MPFEIFNRKKQPTGTEAITITKYGQLSFNKKACIILQREAIEYVLMLWDKEKLCVGIRVIRKKDPRAFTIRWSKRGDGASFYIASFLRHIEYNANESRSFRLSWDSEQQTFEFNIDKEHFIKGGYLTKYKRDKSDDKK